MSNAITATIVDEWYDGKRHFVVFSLTFTGSYTAGNSPLGLALDFALAGVASELPPTLVVVPPYQGYTFDYNPQPTATVPISDGTLDVFTAADTELTTGAFPSTLLNNNPLGIAVWPQLQ
jgi:hypothetical protein